MKRVADDRLGGGHASGDEAREAPQVRRILVPLDGSRHAEPALSVARGLARTCHAEIVLLHVGGVAAGNAMPGRRIWPMGGQRHEPIHAMSLYLAQRENTLRADGVRVSSRIVRGGTRDVAAAIVHGGQQSHADLIVLAVRARGQRGADSMASSAVDVLRASEVPVLLIGGHTRDPFALVGHSGGSRVTVQALDDSGCNVNDGMAWAVMLAHACRGRVAISVSPADPHSAPHPPHRDDAATHALAVASPDLIVLALPEKQRDTVVDDIMALLSIGRSSVLAIPSTPPRTSAQQRQHADGLGVAVDTREVRHAIAPRS